MHVTEGLDGPDGKLCTRNYSPVNDMIQYLYLQESDAAETFPDVSERAISEAEVGVSRRSMSGFGSPLSWLTSQVSAHLRLHSVKCRALVHFSFGLKLCLMVRPPTLSPSILVIKRRSRQALVYPKLGFRITVKESHRATL